MTVPMDKDVDAVLDYGVTWTAWLAAVTDTISASTWAVNDAGITIDSSSFTDTVTTVWLSGGTEGTTYTATNHITTAAGREDDRSIRILAKER